MQSNVLNDLAKAKRLGRKKKWHSWEVHMTRPFFQPNQAPFPARETTEKSKTSQIAPRVQKAPLLIRMTPAWSWWSDDHAHIYVYSLLFGQGCVYSIALPIVGGKKWCCYKSHAQQRRELFLGFGACFLSCTVTAEWIMYRSNSVLFCITLSLWTMLPLH